MWAFVWRYYWVLWSPRPVTLLCQCRPCNWFHWTFQLAKLENHGQRCQWKYHHPASWAQSPRWLLILLRYGALSCSFLSVIFILFIYLFIFKKRVPVCKSEGVLKVHFIIITKVLQLDCYKILRTIPLSIEIKGTHEKDHFLFCKLCSTWSFTL